MDAAAFQTVSLREYEVRCSACGGSHAWSKADAILGDIAV